MKKTVWIFGLISGTLLIVMLIINHVFMDQIGFDRATIIGYTSMVLAALFIYFGVRAYRDNVLGGTIRFGRAMAVGSLILAVSSVFYVLTWEFIFYKFEPDFLQKYQAYAVQQLKAGGATEAQVQTEVAEMENMGRLFQNPFINFALTFLGTLPIGLLGALISAGLLSRRKRDDTQSLRTTAPA